MTTTEIFPTSVFIGKPVHLLDGAALVSLYNAHHPDDVKTTFDERVQSWTTAAGKAAGWKVIEIFDDQVILKMAAKPKSVATTISDRAATGAKEPDFMNRLSSHERQMLSGKTFR